MQCTMPEENAKYEISFLQKVNIYDKIDLKIVYISLVSYATFVSIRYFLTFAFRFYYGISKSLIVSTLGADSAEDQLIFFLIFISKKMWFDISFKLRTRFSLDVKS